MQRESTNQTLIRSVAAVGGIVLLAIVALVIWGPTDNAAVTLAFAAIGIIVPSLLTGLLSLRASSAAEQAALSAQQSSQLNQTAIQDVKQKVADAVIVADATHTIVNSQRTAMEAQIKELRDALESVRSTLAVERTVASQEQLARDVAAAPGDHQ